jgi:hypothetical protein
MDKREQLGVYLKAFYLNKNIAKISIFEFEGILKNDL